MSEIGFRHFAQRDPHAVAVVEARGPRWSYGRLAGLVYSTARALRGAGLSVGDAVAIVAPNCAEYLAVYLAAIEAGLYVVPINWHLADGEIAYVLEDSQAKAVVAHARLGRVRLAALRRLAADRLAICIGSAPGFAALRELAAACAPRPIDGPKGRVMAYTSATTGRPKGVLLPLENADAAVAKTIAWHRSLGIQPGEGNVHLCASMLYHSAPLDGAITALRMGHRVVLADGWQPKTLLALIDRHRVTTSFMVPAMFVRLLKLAPEIKRRYSTASLRLVIHGGAPCPADVKREMLEWWGPVISESYGAAEAQGTIASAAEWLAGPGTVGRPIPGSAVEIVDDAGRALPPGEPGRVYLKPFTGDRFAYKGDPERTRASYRGDFVTVGDVGYLDERGYLFLCGRRADLILSSGMNIYPAEIEHVLIRHPAVADCAVVGVPHALLGEVPKAFVQPMPGVVPGRELTLALLRFLRARLSPMKLPKRIEYTHAIPRDPNGKLYRRLLREAPEALRREAPEAPR